MAPFSLPAPCIIPLRLPVFGGHKSIDTNTKIQLLCETQQDHKIFYTLDGTKPQPYAGIVQGSKVIKYSAPICLPHGKITIKAVAVNANIHTMCSSVVTKRFDVLKVKSENCDEQNTKAKKLKKSKIKNKRGSVEKGKDSSDKVNGQDENDDAHGFDTNSVKEEEHILDCFDEAFIGGSEFDAENSEIEDSIEEESSFPDDNNNNASDNNYNYISDKDIADESDVVGICDISFKNIEDPLSETVEEAALIETNMEMPNATLTTTANTSDSQFCCLKCDLTLQQCISCNKMNAVSSKFCIGCGKQLSRICSFCNEYNPGVASFCQYCGKKLKSESVHLESHLKRKVNHSVMAKPASKNVAIQKLPITTDKCTQTVFGRSPIKGHPSQKRILDHSPGRGYWHQQLDYICNHLKSHAYNNVEFRKEISQPMLSEFKEAEISKEENCIKVTVVFSPLVVEKYGLQLSKETKPAGEASSA